MRLEYPNSGSGELYRTVMKAICGDVNGKSMLDLCCGEIPHTDTLPFQHKIFVDSLDRGGAGGNANFIKSDIFDFLNQNSQNYDVTILSDSIEHFRKPEANLLLSEMYLCSDKQIIFTPLGPHMVEWIETNDPHSHKSGWTENDFPGWASIVFPNFHSTMNLGAFFVWNAPDLKEDFERVKNELNQSLYV